VKVRPTRPQLRRKETRLVANPSFSAPAVFVCFRVSHPRSLEGLWLAFSPSVLGFPRTLGSSASRLPDDSEFLIVGRLLSCTSTPPQRLASYAPPAYSRLMPTMIRSRQAPRYVPSAPQHLRTRKPPFFAPFRRRPTGFTVPAGGPAPRVWLPFQRRSVSRPLEASFSPQRSRASPFRAFLRPGDRKPVSRFPLRSRAFPQNPSALCRRLSGFLPPSQPHPLSLPELLARIGARLLSWAFRPLGFSLRWTGARCLSRLSPSRPLDRTAFRPCAPGTPGLALPTAWLSPSEEGADPSGLSHRSRHPTF